MKSFKQFVNEVLIVVPKSHKPDNKSKKPSNPKDRSGMNPAKKQGLEDRESGKPYSNPYKFKPELGSTGNEDHNAYHSAYHNGE